MFEVEVGQVFVWVPGYNEIILYSLNHSTNGLFLFTIFRAPSLIVVSTFKSIPIDCPTVSFGLWKENYQVVSCGPLEISAILYRILEYLVSRHSFSMEENMKVTRFLVTGAIICIELIAILYLGYAIFVDHAHQTFFWDINVTILSETPIFP